MNVTEYTGVSAPNREALLAVVKNGPWQDKPALHVALPCGHIREWWNPDDIPGHNIECHCGDLPYRHWFIRYDDDPVLT